MGHKTYMELEVENAELRRQVEEKETEVKVLLSQKGMLVHSIEDENILRATLQRQLTASEAELSRITGLLADRDAKIGVTDGHLQHTEKALADAQCEKTRLMLRVKRQKDARLQAMECTRCCECGATCVNSQNEELRRIAVERYEQTGKTEPIDLWDSSRKEIGDE